MPGVDYDNDVDIAWNIPDQWWLEHDSCKYILSCLAHKENKDITMKPTEQRAGRMRKSICEERKKDIAEERAVTQAIQPVEIYGDNEHQMKRVRVEGMQLQL